MNRNIDRAIINNKDFLYRRKFFNKGVTNINQLETSYLTYPSVESIQGFDIIAHIWKQGDSIEKLASQYYGNPSYWWILALFNQKPTEQHFTVGENVYVPTPLYSFLNSIGY
jgi:hypothetical protein